MELMRGKVSAAMEGGDGSAWVEAGSMAGPGWQPAAMPPRRLANAALPQAPARPSMSETLRASFGLASADSAAAPAHVKNAYARLRSFGL
jgi:hypothetical protein